MKKKASLAEKLAAGTAIASASAAWWPYHSTLIHSYVAVMDVPKERKVVGSEIIQGAKLWADHVCDSEGLMFQHAALELALGDAALACDSAAIDRIQTAIKQNFMEQSVWYTRRDTDFPAVTFEDLMRGHVRLFLEAVIHKMDGSRGRLPSCEKKSVRNAVSIGALMTEWV